MLYTYIYILDVMLACVVAAVATAVATAAAAAAAGGAYMPPPLPAPRHYHNRALNTWSVLSRDLLFAPLPASCHGRICIIITPGVSDILTVALKILFLFEAGGPVRSAFPFKRQIWERS